MCKGPSEAPQRRFEVYPTQQVGLKGFRVQSAGMCRVQGRGLRVIRVGRDMGVYDTRGTLLQSVFTGFYSV